MEITPRIKRFNNMYVCEGGEMELTGSSPEEVYMLWLSQFNYRGPLLPIANVVGPIGRDHGKVV